MTLSRATSLVSGLRTLTKAIRYRDTKSQGFNFSTIQNATLRGFNKSDDRTNCVHIRRATLADKDDVLRILDPRESSPDCLPYYYDNIVNHPNSVSVVAVSHDSIVSFLSLYQVDEGKTCIARQLRTSSLLRGKGIVRQIINGVSDIIANKQFRFTSFPYDLFVSHPNTTIISSKPIFLLRFKADDLRIPHCTKHIDPIPDYKLKDLMTNRTTKQYLFPDDLLTVDWVTFELVPSNIALMKDVGGNTTMISDVTTEEYHTQGLFTVSSWFPFNDVICCTIDVYGTNMASLRHHIVNHVTIIMAGSRDKTCSLLVNFVPGVAPNIVEAELRLIGLVRSTLKDVSSGREIKQHFICQFDILKKPNKIHVF